jgi:hypothetical protein
LKWDYFIKNNKPRPYRMLLFGKRGAMQKIEKKIKRYERNAPLKRVLKVEGVGEESKKKSRWV